MPRGKNIASLRQELLAADPSFRQAWEDDRPKRELAMALVRLRRSAGLTQSELARATNWDKAFVSRLEAATGGVPDVATITRYCEACGATAGLIVVKLDETGRPHGTVVQLGGGDAIRSVVDALRAQADDIGLTDASEPVFASSEEVASF